VYPAELESKMASLGSYSCLAVLKIVEYIEEDRGTSQVVVSG
jgi:hypothetical protein